MARSNRRLFRVFDIVFPWGALIALAASCVAVVIFKKAGPIEESLITIATGIVMLGFIPLFYWGRYAKTQHDFTTSHGVYIVLGKKNRPTEKEVEQWTEGAVQFWVDCELEKPGEKGGIMDRDDILEAIRNLRCFFYDRTIVARWYRIVRGIKKESKVLGYAKGNQFVVGYTTKEDKHEWSIYHHEISHPILRYNGFHAGGNYGDNHHRIFNKYKLGA